MNYTKNYLKELMKGDEIKLLRQSLNLSQEKLARQLGVTFTTINRWENNKSKPSPLALEKLNTLSKKVKNE